ncbi:MAG: cell division protein ZapA [Deltaproteobacteria bacterium]|jgi:cell division protein ZapA (FtsZ GTPase activity inhibitor)|nr:cell division protein ZapA [Deltaproteobacteria bacterium]
MSELVELTILNHKFILNSDKDKKYLERLASYVNTKADEVLKGTKSIDSFNVAVLTALNIADDFMSDKIEVNNESKRVLDKVNNIYNYISKSS